MEQGVGRGNIGTSIGYLRLDWPNISQATRAKREGQVMSINAGMMSSKAQDWETPQKLFDELDDEFHFSLDVCATKANRKCRYYFDPDDDALSHRWGRSGTSCFMNPPYGRGIGKWIKKAYEESRRGLTVVCLLPARTDTAYWHDYVMKGEIRFLRGRVHFIREGKSGPAPFPSAVVVFRKNKK